MSENKKKIKILVILVAIFIFFAVIAIVVGSVSLMKKTPATEPEQSKTEPTSKRFKQKKKNNKKKPVFVFKRPVKPRPASETRNSTELTKANSTSFIMNATIIESYTNVTASNSTSLTTQAQNTTVTTTEATTVTTTEAPTTKQGYVT